MRCNEQYLAKKEADKVSYLWDRLIDHFVGHMLAGTTEVPPGKIFELASVERAIRYMALVPRFERRQYSAGIEDIFRNGPKDKRFTRMFMPGPHASDDETAFYFMTLPRPEMELAGGYEQYRAARRNMLETYALAILKDYSALKRVVGIAMEPAGCGGSSEDLILVEPGEWTDNLLRTLEERKKLYGIMQNVEQYSVGGDEFPSPTLAPARIAEKSGKNRKERRAARARAKKGWRGFRYQ
jgi:hypothetical protein